MSEDRLELVRSTWPGHISWVFPKSEIIPAWISGDHTGIAIRMSAHPVAAALCADGAIISTSANRSGYAPAVDLAGVSAQFPHGVDAFFMGDLGVASAPSSIYDVLSSRRLR